MPTKKRSRPKRDELNADPYRLQRAAERKATFPSGKFAAGSNSKIKLPGKRTFVGRDRGDGSYFSVWWADLRQRLGGLWPNVEDAHKAYLTSRTTEDFAQEVIKLRDRYDPQHNHPTRVILAEGKGCPACDAYHQRCRDRAQKDEEKMFESFPADAKPTLPCAARGCKLGRDHVGPCAGYDPTEPTDEGFELVERALGVSVISGTQVRPVSSTDLAAVVVLTRAQSRAIHDRLDVLERDLHAAFREIVSLRSMFR